MLQLAQFGFLSILDTFLVLGGLRDSLPSYLYHLLLAVNCRCNWQLLIKCLNHFKDCWSVLTVITMNCYCLAGFWFFFWFWFLFWLLSLLLMIDADVADWLTVTMSCVSTFHCLDLCVAFHCIAVNLTWKAACLCPFTRVPSGVYSVPDQRDSHRWHRLAPLQLCVRFTLGPSAWTEHPWTTAVTPWEKRPVAPAANWSVLRKTNWYKEILVTF